MTDKESFDDAIKVFSQNSKKPVRDSVIKQNAVRVGTQKKIVQAETENHAAGQPEIQPIVENNEIVGVIYQCTCGKVTEVRFDFE